LNLISQINEVSEGGVRAVCFDLGGVLVQINRNWEDALAAAGIRSEAFGILTSLPELEQFQMEAITLDEYLEALGVHLKLDSVEDALRVHNLILKEPYPGTLELIEQLHERGITTGCLSNTSAPHWHEMLNSGRFPNVTSLEHRLASQELRLHKPDPQIFQAFEDTVGATGREIVFFDDTEEHVDAARERGWRAFWIDHSGDTAEQMEIILIGEGVLPMP
jgi:HAD superfamily hydrolase (TIGR01509 family)